IGERLAARGETISCAESCTGGVVLQLLTEVGGSSNWTAGGFVTYSNELKVKLLGVPQELIDGHGAVSEPVARAMAEGALRRTGAPWAAAAPGIAGPGGGTPEKPVGTVWLALAHQSGTIARLAKYRGDRAQVRMQSAFGALQLLRERLDHEQAS